MWIDLNADLGEGEPNDAALMPLVSSCNIACGGHAGDASSMRETLVLAKQHNVAAGAHPSYPDREGFGRKSLGMAHDHLRATLGKQIDMLKSIADDVGIHLKHLKPHGALYNDAAKDASLAHLIADVARTHLPDAQLVGPPASAMAGAAAQLGIGFIAEGFVDRAYTSGGALVARDQPGAMINHHQDRVAQALQIVQTRTVTTIEGDRIDLPAQTLCLHGDSPGAVISAQTIRAALKAEGIAVRAP